MKRKEKKVKGGWEEKRTKDGKKLRRQGRR